MPVELDLSESKFLVHVVCFWIDLDSATGRIEFHPLFEHLADLEWIGGIRTFVGLFPHHDLGVRGLHRIVDDSIQTEVLFEGFYERFALRGIKGLEVAPSCIVSLDKLGRDTAQFVFGDAGRKHRNGLGSNPRLVELFVEGAVAIAVDGAEDQIRGLLPDLENCIAKIIMTER